MRRPLLVSLGGGLLLLVVVAAGVGWYALGEERRTGRLLSRFLSRQVGIPIRVERAVAEPSRLTLRGVSVPPGEHWGGGLEIRELRVEGGVLPVVFPRGRAVSVVAVSTSVTLAKEPAPLTAPAPDTLTAIRGAVLRFLEWPAAVSLEMKGGELRSGNTTLSFDLRGEKSGDGKLVLRLDLRGVGDAAAFTVEGLGSAAGQDVGLTVRAEGDPRRLGAFWPSALPAPARLAGQLDFKLSEPPELEITGGLTAIPAGGRSPTPVVARFATRYRPRPQRIDLSRLDLQWGPGLRLDLTGSAEELEKAPRLAFKVAGTVDGSRVTGDVTYSGASGGLTARLDLQPFATGLLLERFGYARPAFEVKARSAALRLEGRAEGKDEVRVEGALGLEGVEASPWIVGTPLRANLRIAGTLSRRGGRISLGGLDRGELALASSTADIGLVTALGQPRPARDARAWPLHIEARIPDLSRLPPVEGLPFTLSGEAWVRGSVDWIESSPRFAGHLTAHVTRGEVNLGAPLVISGLGASLPLAFGRGEEASTGSVAAESLTAFGFVLRRLASPALMRGSVLSLPEITYAHYGGSGRGYAGLDLSGAAVPLSMRLGGEGVNLATLTTEYGLTVGRITGKVSYLLVLQHSRAGGLVVGGHVVSDPPGGEINIEALKKLLSYAEADPTGILRRALESLSVFSYESLTGDIRVGPQGGRVSLSLEGRKRLGIFPGRVRAINFRNIPLSLLVKTFGQPRRDSP